ncbi:MAG: hypothetical protein ABIJ26_04805, partial [Candidatus Margulisiibacteriota bacterium]
MLAVSVILCQPAMASLAQYGIMPFDLDSGARPLGMSSSFTGVLSDVNAAFYNPGALPWAKGITITAKNLDNISAAQAYPTGYGTTWGIAVLQKGIKDLPVTGSQLLDYSTNMLVLSVGARSFPIIGQFSRLGLGLNIKTILGQSLRRTGAFDRTATGFEADLGAAYELNPWLDAGIVVQDIIPISMGGKLTWDDGEEESVPAIYKAGLSALVVGDARSPIYSEKFELLATSDYSVSNSYPGLFSLGLEWAFNRTFFLRAGYGQKMKDHSAVGNLSYGAGFRAEGWGLDIGSWTEPLKEENGIYFSIHYFPKEWVFEKKEVPTEYPPISISDPITLIEPIDNLNTYEDRIWVKGKAKPGVDVFINDQRVYVDDDNDFSAMVMLNLGKNFIVIDSYYEGGKLSSGRKVYRSAKVKLSEEEAIKFNLYGAKTKSEQQKIKKDLEDFRVRRERVEALVTMGVVDVAPG